MKTAKTPPKPQAATDAEQQARQHERDTAQRLEADHAAVVGVRYPRGLRRHRGHEELVHPGASRDGGVAETDRSVKVKTKERI
jgi:hypothetical protein